MILLPGNAWWMRGWFALMLMFGGEVLLWSTPRPLIDWIPLFISYSLIATLLLDLAVRYRIRDLYGAMLVTVMGGLLVGLLLYPQTALADFPNHLLTRTIGAHATFVLEMFGLFLILTTRHNRRYQWLLIGYAIWLGFYWGTWVHYAPTLTDWTTIQTPLPQALITAALLLGSIIGIGWLIPSNVQMDDLKLSAPAFLFLIAGLVILFMVQALKNSYETGLALLAVLGLCLMVWTVLWAERSDKGKTLLDAHFPPQHPSWIWIITAYGLFFIMAIVGWSLPLLDIAGYSQLYFVQLLFVSVGFTWLPTALGIIAVRAVDRQSRKLNIM